jgi:hypothetical protein
MTDSVKLTVRLPKEDLAFAKRYAEQHGITVTEFIDRYLRRMRAMEQQELSPDLEAITGLIPSDIQADKVWFEHRASKYSS